MQASSNYLEYLKLSLACLVRDQYRNEFFSRFSILTPALKIVLSTIHNHHEFELLPQDFGIFWGGASAAFVLGQIDELPTINIFVVAPKNIPYDLAYQRLNKLKLNLEYHHEFLPKVSSYSRRLINISLERDIRSDYSEKPLKLRMYITTELATFDFIECMVLIPLKRHNCQIPKEPIIYMDFCDCHRLNHSNKIWKVIPYFKWKRLDSCKPDYVKSTYHIFEKDSSINTFMLWRRSRLISLNRFSRYNQLIMNRKEYITNFLSPYCIRCNERESRLLYIITWWRYKTYRFNSRLVQKLENDFYSFYKPVTMMATECDDGKNCNDVKLCEEIITYWQFITYRSLYFSIVKA